MQGIWRNKDMAKKAESKAKEQTVAPAENVQEATDTTQELPTTEQTTDTTQELPAEEAKTVGLEGMDKKQGEILSDDIKLADEIPELEELFAQSSVGETPPEEQAPSKEKILFYIRTVNAKTAVRSTPEFPMKDSNLIGTIDNKEVHGIVDVANGFGRLAGEAGWIMLDSSVVTRLG